MSELYTVTMTRKQVISSYDDKGRLTGTREIDMPQVYHGLPISTANTYKTTFPNAGVIITREIAERQDSFSKRPARAFVHTGSAPATVRKVAKAPAASVVPAQDYSSLVNAMVEEG